jgi:competence protein ComEC
MSPLRRMARLAWRYAAALGVTSLIAGSVTGFIAITQFYQIGTYGLPANLLAMPFFGTLIMPMAPLSLLLWPLGGAWLATDIMHGGIAVVLAIAGWFTSFDSALWRAGASPDWVLPVAAVGFVFLCLVTSRWRLIGLAPILISALFLGEAQRPIAHLVGRDAITVRQEGGSLKLLRGNGLNYELGIMARYHGQDPDSMGNRLACAKGCGVRSGDRMVVAYLTHTARLSVACKTGDLVILPFHTARYPCKALLLDERSLQRGVPLQIDSNGRTLSIRQASRARMWQR